MTTDTQPLEPTDADIDALWVGQQLTVPQLVQRLVFARAVLAKWGAQPAPASQGDALDTERLNWLTFNLSGKALRDIGVVWSEHGDARRAIDAARAAQEGN